MKLFPETHESTPVLAEAPSRVAIDAQIEKCKRKFTRTNTTQKADRSEGSNEAKADRSEILTYPREIESEVSSEIAIKKHVLNVLSKT